MTNFDSLTLKSFFCENQDFLSGARVQKIQQPTRRDFILFLRNRGISKKLYINIQPQICHICFMSAGNEARRHFEIPKKPPMFCMLLRKYLEGCRISDAKAVENERIFELYIETMDELYQNRSLCLGVELMGKHSNVILYDRATSIIIGCAHNIGAEKSRFRELKGGVKYIYPPTVPAPYKESLISKAGGDNVTVNEIIDNYFTNLQEEMKLNSERSRLLAIVNPKLRRVKNSENKISLLLSKGDNTEMYKLYGELLTANLYKKQDYTDKIEVFDYENNETVTIELDKTKTLSENAQRYFKLYAKSKTTKEKSSEMLSKLKMEREYLENIVYSISRSETIDELADIKPELETETAKAVKQPRQTIKKVIINGFDVYIGKNNRQNDYIVSKLARDDDYWFHTRLCPGSHVLLKTNGKTPEEDVLFKCCKLARENSSAAPPAKAGVIYTRAKFLRKPPAAPPGYVTYKNEKEVLV